MQTWRGTKLLQMLEMTTIGSHSHAVRHLVKLTCLGAFAAALPRWSARLLQLIGRLG